MCFIIYTYKEKFNIINDNNIQILKKSNTSTRKDIIDILHGNSNSNNKGYFDDINSKRDTIMTEINSKVKDINKLIDDKKIIFKNKYISNENNTNITLSSIDNNHKYTIITDPKSDSIIIKKIPGVTPGNIKLNTDKLSIGTDIDIDIDISSVPSDDIDISSDGTDIPSRYDLTLRKIDSDVIDTIITQLNPIDNLKIKSDDIKIFENDDDINKYANIKGGNLILHNVTLDSSDYATITNDSKMYMLLDNIINQE